MVADELTLRHIHMPGMRTDGAGVPCLAVGARMGADGDGDGEFSTLVMEGGVREVGCEHNGHAPDHGVNGTPHRPGDDKDRPLPALARLADLSGDPLLTEEALLAEIVLEHFRELDTGISQNIVVNILCHCLKFISTKRLRR